MLGPTDGHTPVCVSTSTVPPRAPLTVTWTQTLVVLAGASATVVGVGPGVGLLCTSAGGGASPRYNATLEPSSAQLLCATGNGSGSADERKKIDRDWHSAPGSAHQITRFEAWPIASQYVCPAVVCTARVAEQLDQADNDCGGTISHEPSSRPPTSSYTPIGTDVPWVPSPTNNHRRFEAPVTAATVR